MYKFKNLAFMILLTLSFALIANAQDKTVVVNSDGSYSVIEYPVDKEVKVRLLPTNGISSTGTARVMRTANGTKVYFDVNGAPGDWKEVYAYAVDPMGASTYLGPIDFDNGVGTAEFTTPNSQFMLVLSPKQGLKTWDPTTSYVFRSEVPAGYSVIPRGKVTRVETVTSSDAVTGISSTSVSTTVAANASTTYNVPMLGVAKYNGKTTEFKLHFDGELRGLDAKAYLKPVGGKTQIRMTFDDMQKIPQDKRFVLWTSSPEGYTKIGQVIHAGKKDTSEIRGETALADFGLFLTVEDTDVDRPTSRIYSTFTYTPEQ